MRIFLDANILFSAAKSDGAIRQLLGALSRSRHELVADGYVVEEARRNLATKAPDDLHALEIVLRNVTLAPIAMIGSDAAGISALPEKDRPVLAAAIEHRCDFLVTGDRSHFGPLYGRTIGGVRIIAPADLAKQLQAT